MLLKRLLAASLILGAMACGRPELVEAPPGPDTVDRAMQLVTAAINAPHPTEGVTPSPWPTEHFRSQFTRVLGTDMHSVEHGEGDPILLVHGLPTSSFLWRNMIEPLSSEGHVIAIDLIGFGQSDRPRINYGFGVQQAFLEAFIDERELNEITLIVHGEGGLVALPVAAKRPELFSRVVLMETYLQPVGHSDDLRQMQRMFLDRINPLNPHASTYGPGGEAYDGIVSLNGLFERGVSNIWPPPISLEDEARYLSPFITPDSRRVLYQSFQDIPVNGIPKQSHMAMDKAERFLRTSEAAKLYINVEDGWLSTQPFGSLNRASELRKVDIVSWGTGLHFIQEEDPEKLSSIIINWLRITP